ncbi:hypothetical protein AAZX31_09G085200 [Glycine max]
MIIACTRTKSLNLPILIFVLLVFDQDTRKMVKVMKFKWLWPWKRYKSDLGMTNFLAEETLKVLQ